MCISHIIATDFFADQAIVLQLCPVITKYIIVYSVSDP